MPMGSSTRNASIGSASARNMPRAASTTRSSRSILRSPARKSCWRRAPIFMPRPRCRRTANGSPGCNGSTRTCRGWGRNYGWPTSPPMGASPLLAASRAATASRFFSRNGRPMACCILSPTAAAGGICTAAMRIAAARCTRSVRAMLNSARRSGISRNRPTPFCRRRSSSAPIPRRGMTGSRGSTLPPAS
jgi:hypothetical protein